MTDEAVRRTAIPVVLSREWPWLCVSIAAFMAASIWQGGDANWDLLNYHIYDGMAALGNRSGHDIAVAQLQTFFNPALDVLSVSIRNLLSSRPNLLLAVMSLPQAVAAFLAWRTAMAVIPVTVPYRTTLAALTILFGATGAAGLPTVGTTMSDMVPACFMLGGLVILIGAEAGPDWRTCSAGALFGVSAGLKLVVAPAALGAAAALLATPGRPMRSRVRDLLLFSAGGAVATFVVAGPWWIHMYRSYGDPLFPYYNNIFHSPWLGFDALTDERFKPRTTMQAIFYPFYWGLRGQRQVTEVWTRDPRFALAYCAVGCLAAFGAFRREEAASSAPAARNRGTFLVIFVAVAYVAWEKQFSILRYLGPIELLTGVIVLLPILVANRWLRVPLAPPVAMALLVAFATVWTVYPNWGRIPRPTSAAHVVFPPLEDGSLVVLLDHEPMAYIAAYAPQDVVFVGANNNVLQPGQKTLLAQQVEAAIRTHAGPLWGMEASRNADALADATLGYYGLARGDGCVKVTSNLDDDYVQLCPLVPARNR